MIEEGPSAPPGDELERATQEHPSAPPGDELERATARQTFPRRLRLQRRREFLRVQRSGAKHHTRFFLVFVAPSLLRGRAPSSPAGGGLPSTRLGVTVTRKVGKAVKRNRIKRLVREAFRREHHGLPAGLDMVWVAKRDAVESTLEAVVHDMRALAGRLHAPRGRGGPRPGASPSSSASAPARSR
jgi:ribonuclease P protein component